MKVAFLVLLLLLQACYSFREPNKLAIPPIAFEELSEVNKQK